MFFKFVCVVATLVLVDKISAEPPVGRQAAVPYPASGFRPNRPFNLPRDYLPPVVNEFEPQQQPQYEDVSQQRAYDIEIRKQRIDFVGQVQNNVLAHANQKNSQAHQPQNAYLPPSTDEFLQRQELPQPGAPQQFVQAPQRQSTGQRQFDQQHGKPQQQNFFPQNVDLPAQEYGAPDLPEPRRLQADVREVNAQQEENRAAIEALNAAAEAYNRAQTHRVVAAEDDDRLENEHNEEGSYPASQSQRGSRFTKGQYYVLGPDNTVQRVMFSTSQDEQDQRNNGFTAKLRYTPVGEVRDPVFKYNNQGQLVRLFK